MAKEKKAEETKDPLSDLDDLINKEFIEAKDLSKEDDNVPFWLDTGNYALNYACSKKLNGGVPGGRITSIWGLSGTGKSLITSNLNKCKDIARTIIFETEGGGNSKSLFEFTNSPYEKVRIVPIQTFTSYKISKEKGTIEEIKDSEIPAKLETDTYVYHRGLTSLMKNVLRGLEYNKVQQKVLLVVDSLANVKSVRELVNGPNGDMGMTGRNLNDFFSSIDGLIQSTNATLVFTNKVYTNINNPYDPWIQKGGQSVIYNPSLSINLTTLQESFDIADSDLKDEKLRRKTALGSSYQVVRGRISKSRFGTASRNATFLMDTTYGIVKNSGLLEMLCDFGVAIKQGTRYAIPGIITNEKGEDVSFYKKEFLELFGKKEVEYIDKLQKKLEQVEIDIKEKRQNLNVNDLDEAIAEEQAETDTDDEIDMSSMAKAMEAELES